MHYYSKLHTVAAIQWTGFNVSAIECWLIENLGLSCILEVSAEAPLPLKPCPTFRLTVEAPGWRVIARQHEYLVIDSNKLLKTLPSGTFMKRYEVIE